MRTYRKTPAPRKRAAQSVDAYLNELADWIDRDSARVEEAAQADTGIRLTVLNAAPSKFSEGEVITADGTNYAGTNGGGIYQYKDGALRHIGPPRVGTATLVAGTVTVSMTSVTASTVILLTRQTAGGTLGNLTFTLSAGVSFTINSTSGTDTSTVIYQVIEP